jgi:hypothetical protein
MSKNPQKHTRLPPKTNSPRKAASDQSGRNPVKPKPGKSKKKGRPVSAGTPLDVKFFVTGPHPVQATCRCFCLFT